MGQFKFRVPDSWELEPQQLRTVHVIGLDGVPKPCKVKNLGDLLVITRNQNESGRTYISYPFSHYGEITVCTGTLPESDDSYDLVTELARGTLNRLRNQTSIWEEGGLEIPADIRILTVKAIESLGRSIVLDIPDKDQAAAESLDFAMDSIMALSKQFGEQISVYRVSEPEIPDFWFAVPAANRESEAAEFDASFDLLTTTDRDPESEDHKIILGPLFDASPMSSFSANGADFQLRRQGLIENCQKTLSALPNHTTLIHAACGLNGFGHKNLGYRQQVQVTSDILDTVEKSKCNQPVLVSFDYPWAERFAWSVGGIHPLQIADDLLRTGCSLSFVGLDINLDYWPNGSISRDPLQWIDLIDIWCQLGLPLVLCLRVPQYSFSNIEADSVIEFKNDVSDQVTIQSRTRQSTPVASTEMQSHAVANSIRDNLSEEQRMHLIQTLLPMAVARPGVHGIIWRQRSDLDDPRFPHAGLLDEFGQSKQLVGFMQQFRSETLKR